LPSFCKTTGSDRKPTRTSFQRFSILPPREENWVIRSSYKFKVGLKELGLFDGIVFIKIFSVKERRTAVTLSKLLIEKGLKSEAQFMQKLLAERASYQALLEKKEAKISEIKLYRPRGLNPVVDQREELPLLPPCGVMDRDSTGGTSSVLCPRQAAGLPNNLDSDLDRYRESIAIMPENRH